LRVVVGFGLVAGLDTATSNVSPPAPIHGSKFIMLMMYRVGNQVAMQCQ
jgi:hypothetical protein